MRRKDVILPFKEVFSDFLTEKGYVFNKNCFVKYNNGVINLIGIYSRKCMEIVEIDLVFYSEDISEVYFYDLSVENENWIYNLGRIEYHKNYDGIHFINYWEYELEDPDEPKQTLLKMLDVLKDCFDRYFDPVDINDLNLKRQRYNEELFAKVKPDEHELLWDAFSHTSKDDLGIPVNKTIEAYTDLFVKTLAHIKSSYFYLCEKIAGEGCDDTDDIKRDCDSFAEERKLLYAFASDDFDFVSHFAESKKQEEESEKRRNTENNLALLKKYKLI